MEDESQGGLPEFYVPEITPRLHSIDTSLLLSENMTTLRLVTYTGVMSKEADIGTILLGAYHLYTKSQP
jgi:hypothetical protein